MIIDLPTIWLCILVFEIGLYIMLDGMDLGIGMLSLFQKEDGRREMMLHTLSPIWNANETWLVIACGTLFGAFPMAYGLILNALSVPIGIMLLGLIVRAVAFEFREHSHRRFFEIAFGLASVLVVVGQGFIAGGLLGGIAVENGRFAGGPYDWFSPLSILMTLGIVGSYLVVGYAYLIKKTDYGITEHTFVRIVVLSLISFAGFFASTLLLPQMFDTFFMRWTTPPSSYELFALGGLIVVTGSILLYGAIFRAFMRHLHTLCMLIFAFAGVGMLIGVYPYLVPPTITIYDASSSPATQLFMLYGIAPLIPVVLTYNFYLYRVFRRGSTIAEEKESY